MESMAGPPQSSKGTWQRGGGTGLSKGSSSIEGNAEVKAMKVLSLF
jgi:hypothetical protein